MFSRTAREAMTRYQEVFGGELNLLTFADLPPGADRPTDVDADLVMHAALSFGDGDLLMASDDPSGDGSGVKGAALSVSAGDEPEARRLFEALAEGGTVVMPLGPTFWAPVFGMCVDRFGVSWMVGVEAG